MSARSAALVRLVLVVFTVLSVSIAAQAQTCPPPVINAPVDICQNGSGEVSVAPPPGGGAWLDVYWEVTGGGQFEGPYGPQPYASGPQAIFYGDGSGNPLSFRVRVVDQAYCEAEESATVNIRTIPPPVITAPADICANGSGEVSVAPPPGGGAWLDVYWGVTGGGHFQGPFGPESYASGPQAIFYGDGSGNPINFVVRVVDQSMCEAEEGATVNIRTIPPPVINAPAGICTTGSGEVSVMPPPGGGAWLYAYWEVTGGGHFQGPYGPESYASGPQAIFYADGSGNPIDFRVRVVDQSMCEAEATATVGIGGAAPLTIMAPASTCPNRPVTASVPLDAGWSSVDWTITNGTFEYGQTTFSGPTTTFYASGAGTVTLNVTATSSNGCMGSATTNVPLGPQPLTIYAYDHVCAGAAMTASLEDGSSLSNIVWSATNATLTPDPMYDYAVQVTADGTGPVTLSATAMSNDGCALAGSKEIAVDTASPQISAPAGPLCPGLTHSATVTNAGEFASIWWSSSGATFSSPSSATTQFTPSSYAGVVTLYVTGTFASGCQVVSSVEIPLQYTPPVAIWSDAQGLCDGTTVTLTVTEGASYRWSTGAVTRSITVATPGVYSAEVTNAAGCATSASYEVYSFAEPTPTIGRNTSQEEFCEGQSVTLVASDAYMPSYLWSNGATTQSITVTESGTFTVTVTNPAGCSATSAPHEVVFHPVPVITVTSGSAELCQGASVTLTAPEADDYYWSNGANTRSITVTTAGDYTVSTRWESCWLTSLPKTVSYATPAQPVIAFDRASYCYGSPGTATVSNAAEFSSFQWSLTNGTFTSDPTASSVTFTVDGGGIAYLSVQAVGSQGCLTAAGAEVPYAPPSAAITAPGPMCQGATRTASVPDAGPGAVYLWTINGGTLVGTPGREVTFTANPDATSVTLQVSITDGNGCSANGAAPVTVTPKPTAALEAHPERICVDQDLTLTAAESNPNATYQWTIVGAPVTSGLTGRSVTVHTQVDSYRVDYTLTVTIGSCSTTSSGSIEVSNFQQPIDVSGPTRFCQGGSVTLGAQRSGFNYLWSNGATTQSITVTESGQYSLTISDGTGCSRTQGPIVVTVDPLPDANITAAGPATFCDGGSVTLSVPEVSGSIYSWSNGATTSSITVTEAATYNVTVTSAGGCVSTSSAPVVVTELARPAATVSGDAAICAGGSATITASLTGTAPWSITWSDGLTQSGLTTSTVTRGVSPAAGTTYTITAVSDANCSGTSSGSATITVNPNPSPNIQATQIYGDDGYGTISRVGDVVYACGNPTVRLIPALNVSWTYSWSNGHQGAILDVRSSGLYTVTITTPSGCVTTSSITVDYTPIPATPVLTAPVTELCPAGGSITLTAPAAGGWTWSNGATTQSIVVTEAGAYSVRVRNGTCESQPSNQVVITNGTSSITADSLLLCGPGSEVTLTANAGTSWLWSNGATTRSITVNSAGTYSVTTTNNGCTMAESQPVAVTERTVSIEAAGPTTICDGFALMLTASDGTSWLWSNGATTRTIYVSEAGPYTVTASFGSGCEVTSAPVVVEVHDLEVSIQADRAAVCPGGSISLTSNVTGGAGYSYQWFDQTHQPIAGATSPALTYTPIGSGYLYLEVTDEAGCVETSNGVTYTLEQALDATITAPDAVCAGASGSASVADAGADATYAWTISGGTLDSASSRSVTFTPSGSGAVTLTVTITNPGCSATSSKTVAVNPLPPSTITASGPLTFCQGGEVTLTAPSGAGYTYSWSNGSTASSITVNTADTYTVTVSNGSCQSSSSATVVVNPVPPSTITASGPLTFCQGGEVTLTAPSGTGYTYSWSNGSTASSITVSTADTYTVTVSNGACQSSSSATVVVNPVPPSTITADGPLTFCAGPQRTLTAPDGYSYLWSTGATSQSIQVSTSDTYWVDISTATCTVRASAVVTVNPLPPATITVEGSLALCPNTSVTLRAPAGYSYLWSNGATSESIQVPHAQAGSFYVDVTQGTCTRRSSTVTVTALPAIAITTQPADLTMPRNVTRELTVAATGAPTLTFRWYKRNNDGSWSLVQTSTDPRLTIGQFSKKGQHFYRVTISSSTCSGTVDSRIVTVTVN